MCLNNTWGTVCNDNWINDNGIVVCRQLGLAYVSSTRTSVFGEGIGRIWLGDVRCSGSETRLIDCRNDTFYCRHDEDVGVRCAGIIIVFLCKIEFFYMHLVQFLTLKGKLCMTNKSQ